MTDAFVVCRVGFAPFFIDRPHNETVVVGTSVRLVCTVNGAPRPSVTWSRGNMMNILCAVCSKVTVRDMHCCGMTGFLCQLPSSGCGGLVVDY